MLDWFISNSKVIDEQNRTEYLVSDLRKTLHESKWSQDYLNNGINEISEYLYLSNTINNVSGVLFRKSKYIEAGYADHSMKYCGDWYLYIRILLISDIAYIVESAKYFPASCRILVTRIFQKESVLIRSPQGLFIYCFAC